MTRSKARLLSFPVNSPTSQCRGDSALFHHVKLPLCVVFFLFHRPAGHTYNVSSFFILTPPDHGIGIGVGVGVASELSTTRTPCYCQNCLARSTTEWGRPTPNAQHSLHLKWGRCQACIKGKMPSLHSVTRLLEKDFWQLPDGDKRQTKLS